MMSTRTPEPSWRRKFRRAGIPIERPFARHAKLTQMDLVIARNLPCGASRIFIYDEAWRNEVRLTVQGVDREHAGILLDRIVMGILEPA